MATLSQTVHEFGAHLGFGVGFQSSRYYMNRVLELYYSTVRAAANGYTESCPVCSARAQSQKPILDRCLIVDQKEKHVAIFLHDGLSVDLVKDVLRSCPLLTLPESHVTNHDASANRCGSPIDPRSNASERSRN